MAAPVDQRPADDIVVARRPGPGDADELFGEDDHGVYLSPEELASSGGSIVHELMTCLGPRIQRLFIYDESLLTR